jgi:hypothetical protein
MGLVHLEACDILDKDTPGVGVAFREFGKDETDDVQERQGSRILSALRIGVQDRVRLASRRHEPDIRIEVGKLGCLERRDVFLEAH